MILNLFLSNFERSKKFSYSKLILILSDVLQIWPYVYYTWGVARTRSASSKRPLALKNVIKTEIKITKSKNDDTFLCVCRLSTISAAKNILGQKKRYADHIGDVSINAEYFCASSNENENQEFSFAKARDALALFFAEYFHHNVIENLRLFSAK